MLGTVDHYYNDIFKMLNTDEENLPSTCKMNFIFQGVKKLCNTQYDKKLNLSNSNYSQVIHYGMFL